MNLIFVFRNFSTKIRIIVCCLEILFVPLHRVIDKFNEYDNRIQH